MVILVDDGEFLQARRENNNKPIYGGNKMYLFGRCSDVEYVDVVAMYDSLVVTSGHPDAVQVK